MNPHVDTSESEEAIDIGMFEQTLESESIPHVRNYINEFARLLRRFRSNLPKEQRAAEVFGAKVLAKYVGEKVSRSTITRLESGSVKTSWGVVAAYIDSMGLWPEFLKVMITGHQPSRHHMLLVYGELKRKIAERKASATDNLNARAEQERLYGTLRQ